MERIEDKIPIINVVNVNVLDNPTSATNPFQFEIVFEACRDLDDGMSYFHVIMVFRYGVEDDLCR